ncbi:unnamed protein product [Nippostrongylus brasiliensis]|uniref:E3 ubiquitin-protein ligase listerin n=1 Tax=Nippostrongylus brasiliensis TaxID=27835 RepID=A0A0N4XFS9_NIPBR|nr:unnamed protein product [Nippostrongylus brasiliensis]
MVQTASSSNAAAALERSGFLSFREVVSGGTNIFEAETAAAVTRELDQDLMLALRKMSKKDAHTREKALRELLCSMKEKDRDMVELCYTHFVTEANKLIMDGSPTVRMLSLRLISFFISSLRKAAEKHLKNVMPMVLIATRDTSTSVSGQAEAVLTENFPGEKTNQVTQIFAVDTIRLAIEIIAGRHPLVKQQKYDCEDSEADRNSRLTIQCLLVIARLVDFVSSNDELKSALEIFLKETTQIKSLVKGNPSAKSALLGICIKVKNCMPILLESPLVNWIISNLDAQDPDVSARAFEALILFLSDERFYSKFDVHKSVVPKLLSVVRKKGIHWRAVSQFLLPSFALLASNVSDAPNFIRSFLESFNDHLPFEAGDLTLCWVKSLSECVKFAFSNVQILPCLSDVDIINLLVQAVDMLLSEHTDCQECIASLLLWLFEKDVLPVQSRTFLLDSLQITLMNKRPLSDIMCGLLVASSSWVLRAFHVALLRVPPIQSNIIDPLLTCDDDYFMYVDKNVNIISVISKEPPSSNYARLVLRVLRKDPNRVKEIKLSSTLGPWIFSVFSPDDWPMLSSNLGTELLPCLKKIVIMWEKEKNYSAVTRTLKMIDIEQRGEVLSAVLEQPHGIEFVSNLLESLELPDNLTAEISRISFDSLFRNATDNTVDSTLRTLAHFPPCDALIRSALSCYLSETAGQFSLDDLQRVGMVCSQLLFADSRYLALLPTQPELFLMLNSFDFYKTALASYRAIAALLALPAAPAIAQMTLRRLRLSTRPHLPLSSWKEPEKKLQWFWALQEDCSNLTLAPLDHLISRYLLLN